MHYSLPLFLNLQFSEVSRREQKMEPWLKMVQLRANTPVKPEQEKPMLTECFWVLRRR